MAGVASGTAWLLYAQGGPALVRLAAALLPAAFAAGSGAWACLLLFPRVGAAPSRWLRRLPDALLVATVTATIMLAVKHNLVTVQPFAGLLFPPAVWAAFSVWRAMNRSDRAGRLWRQPGRAAGRPRHRAIVPGLS